MKRIHPTDHPAFTIIELLIATAILSVILLMATAVMLNIGNLFYKGFNQSRIQDDVRSVSDNLSQQLKFYDNTTAPITNTPPNGSTPGVLCVGTTRYTYVIGKQISDTPSGSDQIQHVLWQDTLASSSTPCTPVDLTLATPTTGGSELIAPDSRLTAFCVGTYKNDTCTPTTGSPYTITIGAAYGDDDLLSATTGTDAACKGTTGDQFCATAFLGTTADARLGTVSGGGGGGGTTAASCNQPQDKYVHDHSSLYIATDDNGSSPYYTTTDQKVVGGYHGSATDNASVNTSAVGRSQVTYDYVSGLQPPVICLGAQAPPGASTNGSLVGQQCAVFAYDLYSAATNSSNLYNPSVMYGDVDAVDGDPNYNPSGWGFPDYDPTMTGVITASNQCELANGSSSPRGAPTDPSLYGPNVYLNARNDDSYSVSPVKAIGPLLAIVLSPSSTPQAYDYILSTAGSWVDNCQNAQRSGCEYDSDPNTACQDTTDRTYPFPDTDNRSTRITSDPFVPWEQPTITDIYTGLVTQNGCAAAGGYTTSNEHYYWNYVLACAPSQSNCQSDINDTTPGGPKPK